MFICPECAHEWGPQAAAAAPEQRVWKDANGNVLQDGDTVTLVKDLKIKGSSSVVKVGTKVKNIRLIDGDHDIDCKIDGLGPMQLKTEVVKKASGRFLTALFLRFPMPPIDPLPTGLIAVTGDERTGKTSLLRRLSGDLPALLGEAAHPDAQWVDLSLPGRDDETPQQLWQAWQMRSPRWNAALHQDLVEALALPPHKDKKLFMLSAGSRRKVALAGLLASGAQVTCVDQPYVALDLASVEVIRDFLLDMAYHPVRTWVVADYEADPQLPWQRVISLG